MTLPTKLKIKPNCVDVQCYNNKDYVAICVTIEGHILFWPSIFNEYSIDAKIDLTNNDEVSYLISLSIVKFLKKYFKIYL